VVKAAINWVDNSDRDDTHVDIDDYPLWEQLFELEIQGYFDRQ